MKLTRIKILSGNLEGFYQFQNDYKPKVITFECSVNIKGEILARRWSILPDFSKLQHLISQKIGAASWNIKVLHELISRDYLRMPKIFKMTIDD